MTHATLAPPALDHLCDLSVQVGAPIEVGTGPTGVRRMIPILGGTVSGRLQGRLLPGGADYQLIIGGTLSRLDARYGIELPDGARIFVQNTAMRAGNGCTSASSSDAACACPTPC